MCDKAVDNYAHELELALLSKDHFMLIYCSDKHKTPKTSDEDIYNCLTALIFILDCFVTSKMLEKFHDTSLANDDILF